MTAPLEESASQSALHENIDKKGTNSYYFAHADRMTGEERAPMPKEGGIVIERGVAEREIVPAAISQYQFMDDGPVVKVYVPLEGVGALAEEDVTIEYEETSFTLTVQNLGDKKLRKLVIPKLHDAIVPDKSKMRRSANRVTLTMTKLVTEEGAEPKKWTKLGPA